MSAAGRPQGDAAVRRTTGRGQHVPPPAMAPGKARADAVGQTRAAPWTAFFDRDGVFNLHKVPGVTRLGQFEWLPGAAQAFARLNRPDVQTCLCTNQPTVGHLMATPGMVRRVNGHLQSGLEAAGGRLDRVEAAFSPVWFPHRRRKPRPGMLQDGARWLGKHRTPVDPARASMVGDTLKDAQAANAFGCKAILVATTHPRSWLEERARAAGVHVDAFCDDLPAAVEVILGWIDRAGRTDSGNPK